MFKARTQDLSKKELKQLPFQLVFEDGRDGVDQRKAFAKYSTWALPQALAHIGTWKAIKDKDGNYDGVATVRNAISSSEVGSDWTKGLIYFITSHPRGTIIPYGVKATSKEMLPFSALVPLFLAAFKKYQNIPYSKWVHLQDLIDQDLLAAMKAETPEYTVDELLERRVEGSTIRSGDKAGNIKNPLSTTSLTKTGDDEFDKLPRLAKIMLTQCWLAHPSVRNEYMILDPNDWDNMPKPLIDGDVFAKPTGHVKDAWDD